MGGGVTYQGVIPPNRFEKSALILEIEGYQEERVRENFGKIPGGGFLSRGKEMSTCPRPNSPWGPSWWVPRGQGIWPRGTLPFGPCWPSGVPLLAVGPTGKITYLQIFLEFFRENFLKRIFKTSYSGISEP